MKRYILLPIILIICTLHSTHVMAQTAEDTTLCKQPAVLPQFYGGYEDLMNYLCNNIRYPQDSVQGLVIAEFIIEKDGSISHVHILRSAGKTMDNEVIRLLQEMPKWEPAYNENNEPVRIKMAIPVEFKDPATISAPAHKRKRK